MSHNHRLPTHELTLFRLLNWSYIGLSQFTLLLSLFYPKVFRRRRCNCCLYVWDALASWSVLLSPPTTAPLITKRYTVYRLSFVLQHQVESREIFLLYWLKLSKPNGHWITASFNTKTLRWRERTNKMQLIRCLLSNFLSQHVSGIIMPIIRRTRPCPAACGDLPGCVGCGWLWSCGAASWAVCTVWKLLCRTVTDHSQPQPTHPGRTPHAAVHGLVLLMMGIMMPETCWDRKFDNEHRISCFLLVLPLHLMFTMHGHKNLIHKP